jgi:hypothetical protein
MMVLRLPSLYLFEKCDRSQIMRPAGLALGGDQRVDIDEAAFDIVEINVDRSRGQFLFSSP